MQPLNRIIAAFAGVFIGRRFLHKVAMKKVRTLTGVLLMLIALALDMGIL